MPRFTIPEPPVTDNEQLNEWMRLVHNLLSGIGNDGSPTFDDDNISSLSSDTVTEGSTNLFFSAKTTDNLIEGSTNKYFSGKDTDDLIEGNTNLYYTDERVDDRVGVLVVGSNDITVTYDDAAGTLTVANTDIDFGSMYTNSTIAVTLTNQNDWYKLDGVTAWTVGLLNNCTFADPAITVAANGIYEVSYTLSSDFSASPGSSQNIEHGIMIDGTIQTPGRSLRTLANSTDTGDVSGLAILSLTAGQAVSLAARNTTSAGKILHTEIGNMSVIMLQRT